MEERGVLLGLKKINQSLHFAKFSDCIVDYFQHGVDSVKISCSLKDDVFILSEPEQENNDDTHLVTLKHSPECPVKNILYWEETNKNHDEIKPQIRRDLLNKGISVAVSVIIESSDRHILLTQRANNMRQSPRVWVPPGGHLERGESLLECGFREVQEETGIDLSKYNPKTNVLCLWENVFPLLLGAGPPRSHALIVYLHTVVDQPYLQLQAAVKLNPAEVQGNTWLNEDCVREILTTPLSEELVNSPDYFVVEGDSLVMKKLKLSTMFGRFLWINGLIYSGSQCAIVNWYRLQQDKSSKL